MLKTDQEQSETQRRCALLCLGGPTNGALHPYFRKLYLVRRGTKEYEWEWQCLCPHVIAGVFL